jgi:hypothetical protein
MAARRSASSFGVGSAAFGGTSASGFTVTVWSGLPGFAASAITAVGSKGGSPSRASSAVRVGVRSTAGNGRTSTTSACYQLWSVPLNSSDQPSQPRQGQRCSPMTAAADHTRTLRVVGSR